MSGMELFRFILGSIFIAVGVVTFIIEVRGIFHMKVVLNRLHAAGMGDTLGLASSIIGLMIISGFNMNTLKMAFIVVFLWFTSPVATHLLAKLEVETDEDAEESYEDKTK